MAVQERNRDMVNLLRADFIHKQDTAYLAGLVAGTILSLPGLVSFWPMGLSLSDDDDVYPNYAYLPGRAGGQILNGGINSGDDLTLRSTAHATKGNIFFGTSTYDEVNNRLGIKTTNPSRAIQSAGTYYGSATDASWTTDLWGKAIELTVETMIQWLKGGGSISRGIGFSADGNLYVTRSTADDASAAAVHDMVMDSSGNLYLGASGGFVNIGGRLGEAWNGFSFGSGWANYGGGYHNGSLKRVGDLVFLRGLVYRFTGTGTVIATLPSGYRPASTCVMWVQTNTGGGRIDIWTDGTINYVSGGLTWISLDGLVFSTL